MSSRLGLLVVVAAACQGDGDKPPPADPMPRVTVIQPVDGGVLAAAGGGAGAVTMLPSFDPGSGFHLDEGPAVRPSGRLPPREKKVAQILLRSTPSGAMAAVDGVRLGPTPVLWEGWLDGQAREFTFVMAGHALARYRFVPVTDGIVHGSLVRIIDDGDAGVPEIPPVAPPPLRRPPAEQPSRPPPPAAPAPVDAAASPDAAAFPDAAAAGVGPLP